MIEAPDAVLLLLVLALLAAGTARRLPVPMPVLLALVGIGAGVVWHEHPALPRLALEPDTILLLFLPPLLTRAAYGLPVQALRRNLLPIALLAVGLVLASMAAGAVALHVLLPGVPWIAALLVGAILAPPDPVAATAVAQQTGLPHRLVTILEGEGLLNDAIAIVAFHLAVEASVAHDFSWLHAFGRLLWEAPAGGAIGLAVGWIAVAVLRRVHDVRVAGQITLLLPYLAYRLADRLGASGVLATVVLGLVLRERGSHLASPATRISNRTVWSAVDFAATVLVFLLVGLELGLIGMAALTVRRLAVGLAVAAALLALRLAWMHGVPHLVRRLFDRRRQVASRAELTVMGWAGMRGVVSMALALAIPAAVGGRADPALRTELVVVCTVAILATLVLQGVTLLPLVRLLGAGDPEREQRDERFARQRARKAAVGVVCRVPPAGGAGAERQRRLLWFVESGDVGIAGTGFPAADAAVLERALAAQQAAVAALRAEGRLGEPLAARLETEVDTDLLRLRGDVDRLAAQE